MHNGLPPEQAPLAEPKYGAAAITAMADADGEAEMQRISAGLSAEPPQKPAQPAPTGKTSWAGNIEEPVTSTIQSGEVKTGKSVRERASYLTDKFGRHDLTEKAYLAYMKELELEDAAEKEIAKQKREDEKEKRKEAADIKLAELKGKLAKDVATIKASGARKPQSKPDKPHSTFSFDNLSAVQKQLDGYIDIFSKNIGQSETGGAKVKMTFTAKTYTDYSAALDAYNAASNAQAQFSDAVRRYNSMLETFNAENPGSKLSPIEPGRYSKQVNAVLVAPKQSDFSAPAPAPAAGDKTGNKRNRKNK